MRNIIRALSICGRLPWKITAFLAFISATSAFAQTTVGTAATGSTLFNGGFNCSGCHSAASANRFNAINAGGRISLANSKGMGGTAGTAQNFADIAAYLGTLFAALPTQSVSFNTAKVFSIPNIALASTYGDYTGLVTSSGPSRGGVGYSGVSATYTPTTGQCGSDSFNYFAQGSGGGTSNLRTAFLTIANPTGPNISGSAGSMSGTVGVGIGTFTPSNSGGTPLSYSLTGSLPGLSFSTGTGQIFGTPTLAGTFPVTVNAFNCFAGSLTGQSGGKAVSITIAQGSQTIFFAALGNQLTTDAPILVSATGGGSGNPVTFAASGVCTASGTNGSTITMTGAAGSCTVTASQAGNANYTAAAPVMQSFNVSDPSAEVFPPNCQAPAGWAQDMAFPSQNWNVALDFASQGACSFKSDPLPVGALPVYALYSYTGNFQAGTISMSVKVSSTAGLACFLFAIDQGYQNLGSASCTIGVPGLSGIVPFQTINLPITAGSHKIWILYYRNTATITGSDAAWIDQFTMPLLTAITSPLTANVTYGTPFSYQIVADNFPQFYVSSMLPPGLTLDGSTGLISGTPTAAGTYPVTITVSNPGGVAPSATDNKIVTITVDKANQAVTISPINNRLTNAAPFTVSATGGGSGNTVTFTTSGVCTSSGLNGSTITLTGAAGYCTVFADQAGNANYNPAPQAGLSFTVSTAASEVFPANCAVPAGWTMPGTANASWSAEANVASSDGGCSLRSNAIGDSQKAQIQVNATVAAGTVDFKVSTSSENFFDCLFFYIDNFKQTPSNGASCALGGSGFSGITPFTAVSIPVTAGNHTFMWSYEKDGSVSVGSNAIWIDEVVFPQYTLTVSKTGAGIGTVFSAPAGIVCPGSCSAALSGSVSLTAFANPGSYLASWSGGGCSGNGACIVNLSGNTAVTATFAIIFPPGAPTGVSAAPANGQATISFMPPASNGGGAITLYTSTCTASAQTTRIDNAASSPIVATGLTNGVQYSCTVTASNSAGAGASSVAALVTARTVPDAPIIGTATPGNSQATIAFMPPGFNGGATITAYTATCTSMAQPTRQASAAGSPITVTSMVNGSSYSCSVTATNAAGTGATSGTVGVTPLTVPGAPTMMSATPYDSRAIINWVAPASDGGSAITGYTLSCNGGSVTVNNAVAPVTVNGLTNGLLYICTVSAVNAAGSTPSATFSFTPLVNSGTALWGGICTACHAMTPTSPQLNGAGPSITALDYARANQPLMMANSLVQALTVAERTAIANYILTQVPSTAEVTPFQTPKLIDLSTRITVGAVVFESIKTGMVAPANGMLSAISGSSITYTPNPGFVGSDSFTVVGSRDTGMSPFTGSEITINVTVQPPPPPLMFSNLTAMGTNGVAFSYSITADQNPTSYGATGLPAGLSVNSMTGVISGAPGVGGTFMVTLIATNQGGTGMATLVLTLNPAGQTITFPAQAATQPFSPGGTFPVSPLATASSALPVSYVSKTAGVCAVSMTTVTISAAGTCTIGADQGGNINFAAAIEVTRDVTITPTLPGSPNIGMATPGNNQAVVAFAAPTNSGGVAISGYTATCTAMGQATRTGTGSVSPIIVSGLTNLVQYSCSVTATNSQGTGPASGNALVTPDQIPTPASIVSAASASFTVNAPGSFSIVATGYPATFTYAVTGTLPMGVTLNTLTGVLSGTPTQAGTFMVTFSATNSGGTGMQSFTLTVNKTNQTISFASPGTQTFSAVPFALSAVATSGLAVSFVSDTTGVCTVAGSNVTLVSVGTCTIRAQQGGNANFNAAPDAPQNFSVTLGAQSINFGAQVSPRVYASNGMFALSPVAFATSSLTIAYASLTTGVCTISGTTVTMVSAGNCTIAANQSGNANFAAASQVTQSISITGSAPGAPTLNSATGGDTKITVTFTAPASNGGFSINSYTANCSGVTQSGGASPITVTGLTNGMVYSCTITATNTAMLTSGISNSLMATPNPLPGATLWTSKSCGGCHGTPPSGFRLNVGGTTSTVIDYVIPLQPTMNALFGGVTPPISLSPAERASIAVYVMDNIPAVSATTAANTPVAIGVGSQIILSTPIVAFTGLQIASGPANGMITSISGTTINYTPNNGFVGVDTFTYRGTQAGLNGDPRSVSVTVQAAAPAITSALTATGTVNQAFNYQIAATNAPASYDATGLPAGLGVNTATGVISGMPSASGTTMVTISAMNAGGTGNATLAITISLIPQTISFGAQTSPRTFVQGGSFLVSPAAIGGASGNAVVYSSTTPGVCTVSGATATMVAAGICTLAANQAGNATYAAAAQVTQSVSITGVAPAAPTIGTAAAGNTQATINFTPPANTGGLPITGYTVNCSGITLSGPGSPIVLSGLTNGTTYSCTVQATNLAGTSLVSGVVMVTPVSTAFTGVVFSRKDHNGLNGDLPIDNTVPLTGAVAVEPRTIGAGHRIVFGFNSAVSIPGTAVATDVSSMPVGSASTSVLNGNYVVVTLTGIPDAMRVLVTLSGVNGGVGATAAVGFLVGDVTNNHVVNAADISAVKARVGQPVTISNFQFDLNATGSITQADVTDVKARSGLVLP